MRYVIQTPISHGRIKQRITTVGPHGCIINKGILICTVVITGISARPVNSLVIKASAWLSSQITVRFLQQLTEDRPIVLS